MTGSALGADAPSIGTAGGGDPRPSLLVRGPDAPKTFRDPGTEPGERSKTPHLPGRRAVHAPPAGRGVRLTQEAPDGETHE